MLTLTYWSFQKESIVLDIERIEKFIRCKLLVINCYMIRLFVCLIKSNITVQFCKCSSSNTRDTIIVHTLNTSFMRCVIIQHDKNCHCPVITFCETYKNVTKTFLCFGHDYIKIIINSLVWLMQYTFSVHTVGPHILK